MTKKQLVTLDDGTVVRAMTSSCPVSKRDLSGRRVGDIVVGYRSPAYFPKTVWLRGRRYYTIRRAADGSLWVVHNRKREPRR